MMPAKPPATPAPIQIPAFRPAQSALTELSRPFGVESRALAELESAVHEVIRNGWEDSRRRRASELSSALLESSRKAGSEESTAILAVLMALLALPIESVLPARETIRDQMLGFLGQLTKLAQPQGL